VLIRLNGASCGAPFGVSGVFGDAESHAVLFYLGIYEVGWGESA
jgi:hypothetical protein